MARIISYKFRETDQTVEESSFGWYLWWSNNESSGVEDIQMDQGYKQRL